MTVTERATAGEGQLVDTQIHVDGAEGNNNCMKGPSLEETSISVSVGRGCVFCTALGQNSELCHYACTILVHTTRP